MSYESETLKDWYLLFHYASREEILEGVAIDTESINESAFRFPLETVAMFRCRSGGSRALDIGCAVGRSSFELSRIAKEVIGIDFSQSFVDAAENLRSGQSLAYRRFSEQHLWDVLSAQAPANSKPTRIRFEQGDAMALGENLGTFDLIHAANLLCRLPEPLRFLERLPSLVRSGGELVLATPATWLEQYTPRENQPESLTLEYLEKHLGGDFVLQEMREIPFVIREHQRKLQLSTSQTSLWTRK